MLCGVTPHLIRVLCENPWEGGAGYTPGQVGDMTLDQAYMRLTDRAYLRKHAAARTTTYEPALLGPGPIKGIAADGTPFTGKIGTLSVAARLAAEQAAAAKPRRRRRGQR